MSHTTHSSAGSSNRLAMRWLAARIGQKQSLLPRKYSTAAGCARTRQVRMCGLKMSLVSSCTPASSPSPACRYSASRERVLLLRCAKPCRHVWSMSSRTTTSLCANSECIRLRVRPEGGVAVNVPGVNHAGVPLEQQVHDAERCVVIDAAVQRRAQAAVEAPGRVGVPGAPTPRAAGTRTRQAG